MTSDASDNRETSQTPRQPADTDELRVEFDVEDALQDIEATAADVDAADVFILDESAMVRPVDHDDRPRTPCPVCGEAILNIARVCRYCGEEFESPLAPPTSTTADTWERPVNPFGPDDFELDEIDSDQGAGVPSVEFNVNAVLDDLGVDVPEADPDDLLVLTPDLELNDGGVESPKELLKRWNPREADSSITRRPCPKCLQMLPRKATECRFCGARAVPAADDTIVLWISAEFDHVRLSLKRSLSVAACFLVAIATISVMLLFLATTSGRIRSPDVALILLFTVLTPACVVGAIVIWREHIWPVYGALLLTYVLTALLLMVQPLPALSIGGSVLFYCHRALWLADRLRAEGEPRFDALSPPKSLRRIRSLRERPPTHRSKPNLRNRLESLHGSDADNDPPAAEPSDARQTRRSLHGRPGLVRHYHQRLKRHRIILAGYLVVISIGALIGLAVVVATPGLHFGVEWVPGVIAALTLTIVGAMRLLRGYVWPVFPVTVIGIPLSVFLAVWLTPVAALLVCGIPLVSGSRAAWLAWTLTNAGLPLSESSDLRLKHAEKLQLD